MKTMRPILANALLLAVLLGAAPATGQAQRDQLKQRFESRYSSLVALKQAGKVGETWGGFIDAVEPRFRDEPSVRTVVEEENRDRRALYASLAEELKAQLKEPQRSEMTPQMAAERNALRNFEKASETEQLAVAEATWVTKKDRPWLLALLDLESKGKIGETMDGYVAAVGPESVARLNRIVGQENEARGRFYENLAQAQSVAAETVARDYAKRYYTSAHVGDFLLKPDGGWSRKVPETR